MSNGQLYDVAITGGGLAGLCLAIQCADNGLSTVLFEKEQYPFHKVCGEYISLESRDFLKRLGVPLDELKLPVIKNLSLSDTKGNLFSFRLPLGGIGISRFKLDDLLYRIALSKGVEVHSNTKVNAIHFGDDRFTVETNNMSVQAKVAVAAFGKRSNLDVKWSRPFVLQKPNALNNYIGIKYHIRYAQQPENIALHNFQNGYCGISKIEDDKSCLCYLTTAENLRKSGNSIPRLQQEILCRNPHLRQIFTNATFLYEQPLAISQISFSKKDQVENHVLMVGDAAGMISPLCGNGMSMAMHASKLAFSAIERFINGEVSRIQMEEEYALNWKKQFSSRLFIGQTVQRLFGGYTSTSLFLRAMYKIPFIARKIIRATHGESF